MQKNSNKKQAGLASPEKTTRKFGKIDKNNFQTLEKMTKICYTCEKKMGVYGLFKNRKVRNVTTFYRKTDKNICEVYYGVFNTVFFRG